MNQKPWYVLFGMAHIKYPLLLIEKSSCRFPIYLNVHLLYVQCHLTINKIFPSFFVYKFELVDSNLNHCFKKEYLKNKRMNTCVDLFLVP